MVSAKCTVDPAFVVAEVPRRLFGSFVEHMGRCAYGGIYDPGHPQSDEDGFRKDVLDLIRELGVTVVRYPGGNFVSNYYWEDGVGPVDQRPRRLDLAWHTLETNRFGLDEFMAWTRRAGVEAMLATNLGTRGIDAALSLLEYCNIDGGTEYSERRIANGTKEPHNVRMWCLGNEMDGPWQVGHKTAEEYGRLAAETGRAMRMVDPTLELVACGSSHRSMPTFAAWEATVLDHTLDVVDFISAHAYYQVKDGDVDSFLASSLNMEAFIAEVVATIDHVAARKRSRKRVDISFDEWNVWYNEELHDEWLPTEWVEAPPLSEDAYTVTDAVVVGSLLITLLRNCDRVTSACLAQLVNTIATIRTSTTPGGPAWRQTTFYPFSQAAQNARGQVLRVEPVGDVIETKLHGEAPCVDAVATYDEETLTLFAVNRHRSENAQLSVDLRGVTGLGVVEHLVLADDDPNAANTESQPDRVTPRTADTPSLDDGQLEVTLSPVSWNVIRLARR